MKLFRTNQGPVASNGGRSYLLRNASWDELLAREDLFSTIQRQIDQSQTIMTDQPAHPLAPVGTQEVWAAGVTYWRSREARMEESKSTGGGDFYDRVYAADRPELFFKSSGSRVIGTGGKVRIRRDSKWNVPEPELTLLIASTGRITGYTIGNDMSSRDIEGENPLYLPQAKVYDGSCAIGPSIWLADEPIAKETAIQIRIRRGETEVFSGATAVSQIKRSLPSLAEFLYRESSHPNGCFLMTGTGVVPPDSFTLKSGDEIAITIEPIGTLVNTVA
jgi:2-dehydro-3-deoxy-D-arabinonate dehydratase